MTTESSFVRERTVPFVVSVLVAMMVVGCRSREAPGIAVFPTSGRVLTADGKPATGATISFQPVRREVPLEFVPHGDVGADGVFRLTSRMPEDGAPEGDYAVTVVWRSVTREGEAIGPDRLRGRYADPKKPLGRVTVRAGDNVLEPFHLK